MTTSITTMIVQLRRKVRRRCRGVQIPLLTTLFVFSFVSSFSWFRENPQDPPTSGLLVDSRSFHRKLLSSTAENIDNSFNVTTVPVPTSTKRNSEFPNPLFTYDQLKQGAVVLYIIGVLYMFVALSIVCDEFFVPALEVITIKLDISGDVAGATFMAAGGSAPELFTSFIGVFLAHTDVGIGTIVGSAVFNILFVIGVCALVSREILALTWWPLFRDVSFYSAGLILLIVFFQDDEIFWWEALILFCWYFLYVVFMKFNSKIEGWVRNKIGANKVTTVRSTDNLINGMANEQTIDRLNGNIPPIKGNNKFRHGFLQLMIHTIDPLGETKVHEKALKLHAMASLKVIMNPASANHNGQAALDMPQNGTVKSISNGQLLTSDSTHTMASNVEDNVTTREVIMHNAAFDTEFEDTNSQANSQSNSLSKSPEEEPEIDDDNEPLDMSWPDTCRKRITYIILFPLLFPMWLTIPDVRKPQWRNWFPLSFIASILWIAVFSYLMNWWAAEVGEFLGIPDPVMGLTFLAAGTSIPDLITSVIVAKKGYGDMAISSSIGSNIFDVTVGLPVPWILYGLIEKAPYVVNSKGMFCSILLLFIMLMLIIVMIAAFRWRMNKPMGFLMLFCYFIFLTLSLLLELEKIGCPA